MNKISLKDRNTEYSEIIFLDFQAPAQNIYIYSAISNKKVTWHIPDQSEADPRRSRTNDESRDSGNAHQHESYYIYSDWGGCFVVYYGKITFSYSTSRE